MLKPANVQQLLRLIHTVHFAHFAPPCGSFSIARRGGAPRSREYPMGRPILPEADQIRVSVGNTLLAVTCRAIRLCRKLGIGCSLENPRSSRVFLCPALQKLHGIPIHTVFCGWGTKWRKATTFLVWNCARLGRLARCCSSADGRCIYTNERHQVLQGNAPGGKPWTQIAQPYPKKLCREFAKCVSESHLLAYHRQLDSLSGHIAPCTVHLSANNTTLVSGVAGPGWERPLKPWVPP